MLEEMGEPYRLIEKSTRADDLQSTEYLRLNPNARIPTLVDGNVVLWESMAINLYLAQKYEGPMHCAGPEVLGLAAKWSFWAILEMEALLLELLQHRAMLPEFARDASYAERDELLLKNHQVYSTTSWWGAIIWLAIALPSPTSTWPVFSSGAKWPD
jgi:glutathione S-transferase